MMIRSPCRLCWGLVTPHNPHTSIAKGLRVLVTKGRSSLVPVGRVILQGNTSRLSYLRSVLLFVVGVAGFHMCFVLGFGELHMYSVSRPAGGKR